MTQANHSLKKFRAEENKINVYSLNEDEHSLMSSYNVQAGVKDIEVISQF